MTKKKHPNNEGAEGCTIRTRAKPVSRPTARRLSDLLKRQAVQLLQLRNELAAAREAVDRAARLVAAAEQSPVLHIAVKR